MSESGTLDRRSQMVPIAYIVGVLLFLLPFAEIRCNNESFAQNTGVGLALGTNYKVTGQIKAFSDSFGSHHRNSSFSSDNGKMYVVALVSFILGIAGFVLSLATRKAGTTNMFIGVIAAICLIILAFQMKSDVNQRVAERADDGGVSGVVVTVNFTPWYYLSVISFLAAAFMSFKFRPEDYVHEHPPKNAPQVPINNPGDQSAFPTSPEEEEMER